MIKRLSKCIREYKLPSILAPIFIAMEVILEVFIPLIMGKLMDNGIEKGDISYVIKAGVLLVILCSLSLLSGVASGTAAAKASSGFAKNLRHDMYHNVQNFSFASMLHQGMGTAFSPFLYIIYSQSSALNPPKPL